MPPRQSLLSQLRISSIMMGIGCVLTGTACAAICGNTEVLPATLCILFAIFLQLAGNFYYRYYDITHNADNESGRLMASHSNPDSYIPLREFSLACALLAAMCGLSIATMAGPWALAVGVATAIISWVTIGGSLPLLRTPYGIVCPFILFGPICVITTSIIQSIHDSAESLNWHYITPSLYMSIVMGLMCVNATMLYSYANYYSDKRISKDTFVVAVGRKWTRIIFMANSVIYTVVTIFMCLKLDLPVNGLDMLPSTICFILDIYIWWQMRARPRSMLKPLVVIGNFNVLLMGLLTFIIFELTGAPDNSSLTFFGL